MGMYAKLRHISVADLKAAKKDPAKFYRSLLGLDVKVPNGGTLKQSWAHQLSTAIKASPAAKELADMPEARRIAEATQQRRAPDPADQQAVTKKMMEVLATIRLRPELSGLLPTVPEGLELEKSWHCLHFMFSGKVWETGKAPIEKAILGGTEIPDVEGVMGYGPVRFLEHGDVMKIAAALARYPIEQAALDFDPSAAAAVKIYCPNHSSEELVHYFDLLKNYYRQATSKKRAMLLWTE